MATVNAVGNALTGSTGSGAFVGATSPSLVTPTLGAATATSITFSPTTGGIVGTTTNDNASTSYVGEYVSSTVLVGSAVSLTNNTAANVTSISLTAGDWDVWGNVGFNPNGATTMSVLVAAINTTSATLPTSPATGGYNQLSVSFNTGGSNTLPAGMTRISISGTTTVYLIAYSSFGVSTNAAYGFIGARCVR